MSTPKPGGIHDMKECPLCGETLRIRERELVDRIPGSQQTSRRQVREWTCPECDYYQEVSEGDEQE